MRRRRARRFAHMFDQLAASRRPPHRAPTRSGRGRGWKTRRVRGGCRRSPTCSRPGLPLDGSAERDQWCLDNWDLVAAEVAAAHTVSLGVASHQLMMAMALRERLPRVAEVFAAGAIGLRLVPAIVYRTALIVDPQARAKVDVELAAAVAGWGPMSVAKTEAADRLLGGPLRPVRAAADGPPCPRPPRGLDPSPTAAARHDRGGAVRPRRRHAGPAPGAMARAVCDGDPRTLDQRRADALGALAAGADRLACACGHDDCPAAGTPASAVVINVIADEKSLSDDTPVALDGVSPDHRRRCGDDPAERRPIRRRPVRPPPGGDHRRSRSCPRRCWPPKSPPARPSDGTHPGDAAPEPRYRPSRSVGPVRALPRHDLPLPRLRRTRRRLRPRPHHRLPGRADLRVEPQMPMPKTPPAQNVLAAWLRPPTTRRHRDLDLAERADLHHPSRQPPSLPALCRPTAPSRCHRRTAALPPRPRPRPVAD